MPISPTALGLLSGTVCLLSLLLLLSITDLTAEERAKSTAALTVLALALLLGFAQDVLHLQRAWQAALPGLVALALAVSSSGPLFQRPSSATEWVYTAATGLCAYVLITSFSLTSGINGLKTGQAYFLAVSLLTLSLLVRFTQELAQFPLRAHFLACQVQIPFVFTTVALLKHCKFPSSGCSGASFAYFAGTSLAVSGLWGAFSPLWILLLSPQIAQNLLYLYGLMPFNMKIKPMGANYDPKTGLFTYSKAHNGLFNYYLFISGPLDEESIATHMYLLQVLLGLHSSLVRFHVFSHLF